MYTHICIYTQSPNTFSIHSSIIGHLLHFHILAIVLSAAIYSGMYRSLWVNGFVSWGKIPRSEIARYMSALFLLSENLSHCFPLGLKQTTSPPAVGENSFLPHPCQHRLSPLFYFWYVISYCLIWISLISNDKFFHVPIGYLYVFFRSLSVHFFPPFFNRAFFKIDFVSSLYILDTKLLSYVLNANLLQLGIF